LMAQKIAKQLGLAVGISSGANLVGAVLLQEQFGGNAVVVTVFSDSNKKYLSTDLVKNEPSREDYISPDVEFIDYMPVKR
jgi:cysteine synthase